MGKIGEWCSEKQVLVQLEKKLTYILWKKGDKNYKNTTNYYNIITIN